MFPKNSAFDSQELGRGQVTLPKPGDAPVRGETKRFGVVEIPREELEAWNRELDNLVQADYRTSSIDATRLRISDVRDQIYRWLH